MDLSRPRDRYYSWKKLSYDDPLDLDRVHSSRSSISVQILIRRTDSKRGKQDKTRAEQGVRNKWNGGDREDDPHDDVTTDQWLSVASLRNARWSVWIDSKLFRIFNGVMTNYRGTPVRPCVRSGTKDNKDEDGTRGRMSSGTKAARPNKVSVRSEETRSSSWKSCSHKSEMLNVTRNQLSKWRCHRGSARSIRVKLWGQSPSKSVTKETLKSTLVQRRNRAQGTDKFSARAHETDCTNRLNPRTTK